MEGATFNDLTRAYTQTMSPLVMQAQGTTQSADLPTTGYLAAIDLIFTGTITTAGASSTTNLSYIPVPWGLIRRIQLRTNEGADVWNTSGWGAYLYNRTIRTGFDPMVNHLDFLGGFVDPYAAYTNLPGSLGASATFNFAIPVRLQLTWGEMLMSGLILLQNPGTRFTLSIDFGTTADLWSATTGTVTLTNVQVIPALECFLVPDDDNAQPDMSLAKTVLEDIKQVTATGTFVYEPPRGNTYTRFIQEFVNGPTTAYVPIRHADSATAGIVSTNVVYSQTQNLNTDLIANRLYRQRRLYGGDMPTGVLVHEYSLGNGVPEFPNGRDNLDTSQITDMAINTTISSGFSLQAGAYARTVKEQLVVVEG
jgi:hypothetical protein